MRIGFSADALSVSQLPQTNQDAENQVSDVQECLTSVGREAEAEATTGLSGSVEPFQLKYDPVTVEETPSMTFYFSGSDNFKV